MTVSKSIELAVGQRRMQRGLMKLGSSSLLHSVARHRSQLKFTPPERVELLVQDALCSGYNLQETYSRGRLR